MKKESKLKLYLFFVLLTVAFVFHTITMNNAGQEGLLERLIELDVMTILFKTNKIEARKIFFIITMIIGIIPVALTLQELDRLKNNNDDSKG